MLEILEESFHLHPVRACLYLRQASAVPFQTKDTSSSPTFLSSECPKPWRLRKNGCKNQNMSQNPRWKLTVAQWRLQQWEPQPSSCSLAAKASQVPSAIWFHNHVCSFQRWIRDAKPQLKFWAEVDRKHCHLRPERWQSPISIKGWSIYHLPTAQVLESI